MKYEVGSQCSLDARPSTKSNNFSLRYYEKHKRDRKIWINTRTLHKKYFFLALGRKRQLESRNNTNIFIDPDLIDLHNHNRRKLSKVSVLNLNFPNYMDKLIAGEFLSAGIRKTLTGTRIIWFNLEILKIWCWNELPAHIYCINVNLNKRDDLNQHKLTLSMSSMIN